MPRIVKLVSSASSPSTFPLLSVTVLATPSRAGSRTRMLLETEACSFPLVTVTTTWLSSRDWVGVVAGYGEVTVRARDGAGRLMAAVPGDRRREIGATSEVSGSEKVATVPENAWPTVACALTP